MLGRRSSGPLPGFVAVELLCASLLILLVGLPVIEDHAGQAEFLFAVTLIPTWAVVAWAWREGRAALAWIAASYPLAVLGWLLWTSVLWYTGL